jgi:hypothetical protein
MPVSGKKDQLVSLGDLYKLARNMRKESTSIGWSRYGSDRKCSAKEDALDAVADLIDETFGFISVNEEELKD